MLRLRFFYNPFINDRHFIFFNNFFFWLIIHIHHKARLSRLKISNNQRFIILCFFNDRIWLYRFYWIGIDDLKTRFICIFVFKYEILTINRYRSFLDWFTFQNLFRLSFISHNLFITKHQYRKHKKQ